MKTFGDNFWLKLAKVKSNYHEGLIKEDHQILVENSY